MPDTSAIIQQVTLLHQLIASRHKNDRTTSGIQRLNVFMTELKSVGIIDGIDVGGHKGRYFLIDGSSWVKACKNLKHLESPNFVLWEESAFFSLLEQLISTPDKSHAARTLNRKHAAHT
jgi:hypothetical protein